MSSGNGTVAASMDWKPTDDLKGEVGLNVTSYMRWWAHQNPAPAGAVRQCKLAQAACMHPPDSEQVCEELVPLPDFVRAPAGTGMDMPGDLKDRTTKPPRDTVITGIIDEGIALGHARFRKMLNGTPTATRVMGAWQQGARYGGADGAAPAPVPFGHVLLQSDINALMVAHSAGGWLDEDAFNRAAGLTEMATPMGVATLERVVAHGTHVLDLAAGFDPATTPKATLDQRPILAVTLPRREAIAMSGTFLQFFVVHAMQWIVDMADALWAKHYPKEAGGFPVVLNLSFGQHAGPKNASSQIEQAFRALKAKRHPSAPLQMVMPVGNDNLAKGYGHTQFATSLAKTKPVMDLPWRIQPEDYSTNFMEFWLEMDGPQPDGDHPLVLDIALPDGQTITGIKGRDGHFLDLPGAGRIYARRALRDDGKSPPKTVKQLYQYLICTSATLDETGKRPVSPAGIWRITARWDKAGLDTKAAPKATLHCTVQVDQAFEMGSLRNRRSYFDHPRYQSFDRTGRQVDTFDYPKTGAPALLDGDGADDVVQRRGTLNALATDPGIIVVGGYRRSDGRPAPYSATSHADGRTPFGAAKRMTASLPTEAAPAHFGLRAAGSKSSALVNLRGTSFAAGLATRQVVDLLLDWCANGRSGSVASYAAVAKAADKGAGFAGKAHPLKVGSGRVPASPARALDRLTWGGP